MKKLLKICLVIGVAYSLNSCKAGSPPSASAEKDPPLKARVFMAPFAECSEGGEAGSCMESLQEALAMFKLSYLEWPENPEELTDIREAGSCWSDPQYFSELSWKPEGDSLLVSYSRHLDVSEQSESGTQEGEFILITDQETIRVIDFSYRDKQ